MNKPNNAANMIRNNRFFIRNFGIHKSPTTYANINSISPTNYAKENTVLSTWQNETMRSMQYPAIAFGRVNQSNKPETTAQNKDYNSRQQLSTKSYAIVYGGKRP